jgi:peptidoglycan/xylan/chitin deacetylase (PgdA/CDA1 family)
MPVVCITGDVHHNNGVLESPVKSFKVLTVKDDERNQEYKAAEEYTEIVEDHDFTTTLFVTGKSVTQHRGFWQKLSHHPHVELGGHTYAAMPYYYLHLFFSKVFHSYYGPYLYQKMDIKKTCQAFASIGLRPVSWRTHRYCGCGTTYKLLNEYGFKVVSDIRKRGALEVRKVHGLTHVAINTMTDDLVFPYYLKDERKKVQRLSGRLERTLRRDIAKRRDLVINLHPICQKILNNFGFFEKVMRELSDHDYLSVTISDLAKSMAHPGRGN